MKTRVTTALLGAAAAAWPITPLLADEAPPLRHNPFARPPSEVIVERSSRGEVGPAEEIVLTATMVSSAERLAHVSGRVLRPGDEIGGRILLRVHEDRAVFLNHGEEATVYVKPELVESDEEKAENRTTE